MAGVDELETEMTVVLTTGSVIKYKYKRENGGAVITRTLTTPQGTNTTTTTIEDIRTDSNALKSVADHFAILQKVRVD